jgi:hypothetical protein
MAELKAAVLIVGASPAGLACLRELEAREVWAVAEAPRLAYIGDIDTSRPHRLLHAIECGSDTSMN